MLDQERLIRINIEEEMKTAYIDYSMSVIVSRALPDVRDGFKPVHRRVLFGMNELGNNSDKPYKKSARIVGEVMGKYHPHGDFSIYGTLVRMAQPWALRYPLVDGQGNFGSVDGDGPAAMRYTEARLQKIAEEMLKDIDKDTVNFDPNFDETLKEPQVMPTRLPNLLVKDLTDAIIASKAETYYVCNVATQKGETDGFNASDHVKVIEEHLHKRIFNLVLCNRNFKGDLGENAEWVAGDKKLHEDYRVYEADLIDDLYPWRHSSKKLAKTIINLYEERTGPLE